MVGTYTVDPLGTGTMTINFTPEGGSSTCGASTGLFDFVLVSRGVVEVASSGQVMADPSKANSTPMSSTVRQSNVPSSARDEAQTVGAIATMPILGGMHHQYFRV
jgi:hypothetical protein